MLMIILLILIGVLLIFVIGIFNRLVIFRNRCENAWSQVDVQLKKRADLVPNLVETVKGYAAHERGVFEEVTKARSSLMNATTVADIGKASDVLTQALKSLFAVVENYPQLKADQQFLLLQEQLDGIESKIAYARQFYNDTVLSYTNLKQVFPSNMISSMFNFADKEYFQIAEEDKGQAKVKF